MNAIRQGYRLFALTMAILMLSTSVGLAVNMHFCGGKLVSISFFGELCRPLHVLGQSFLL